MTTPNRPTLDSPKTQYIHVILMGVSAFVMNTTEFVPVALLSDIANDFSITTADAGWMLTIYAWVVAVMSLPLMWFTRHYERKRLMLLIFSFFVASHALSAFAWRFEILLISRIGVAFAHALFWSITAAITIRVAPKGKRALALSVLATGTSLALVLGVPIGRVIGQWFGWRITFAVIGAIAAIVFMLQAYLLPALPSQFQGSIRKIPELLKNPLLICLYVLCFLTFTAHYTAYSYIEPFMRQVGAIDDNLITLILLICGGAGIIGSVLFSYWGERYPTPLLLMSILMMLLSLSAMLWSLASIWTLIVVAVVWGAAIMLLFISIQAKVLAVDSEAQDMLMSMYSGIINLGIGTGALLGGYTVTTWSLAGVGFVGAAVIGMGLLLVLYMIQRFVPLR